MTPRERQWARRGMKGATDALYEDRLAEGKWKCWICRRGPVTRALAWDHDHKTGKPRGALCFRCNRLLLGAERLGGLELMKAAVAYLESWEGVGKGRV